MNKFFILMSLAFLFSSSSFAEQTIPDDWNTFQKVLRENPKILVEFTADWCSACKLAEPVITAIEPEMPDTLILKIDSSNTQNVAKQLGINEYPTFVKIDNGFDSGHISAGWCGKSLVNWMEQNLSMDEFRKNTNEICG